MQTPTQHYSAPDLSGRALSTQGLGQLRLERQVSRGAHGIVYHARTPSLRHEYAVKHVLNAHLSPQQRLVQRREAELHRRVGNLPGVNPFLEACMANREGAGWFLITDFFSEGDLFSKLPESGGMSELEGRRLLLQLLDTMVACHDRGVYHRDLKPENILVDRDADGRLQLNLTDFGMATDVRVSRERGCGSVIYMSPETIYSMQAPGHALPALDAAKQDVWSCAQLAVNLFLSVNAWHLADPAGDRCYQFYLKNPAQNLLRFLRITPEFNRILTRAFHPEPAKRCSMREFRDAIRRCDAFVVSEQQFEVRKQWMRALESERNAQKVQPYTAVEKTQPATAHVESGNDSGVELNTPSDQEAARKGRRASD